MASITEVARLAGVSTATASRVVSAADYPVSPATRGRVLTRPGPWTTCLTRWRVGCSRATCRWSA